MKDNEVIENASDEEANPDDVPLDGDAAADVAAWANEPDHAKELEAIVSADDAGAVDAPPEAEVEAWTEEEETSSPDDDAPAADVEAWAEEASSGEVAAAPEQRTAVRHRHHRGRHKRTMAPIEHAIAGGEDEPPKQDDETSSPDDDDAATIHNVTYVLCDCGCRTEAPVDETDLVVDDAGGAARRVLKGHTLPEPAPEPATVEPTPAASSGEESEGT